MSRQSQPFKIYRYFVFRNQTAKRRILAKQLFFTYPDKIQRSKLLLLNEVKIRWWVVLEFERCLSG
jgi:hypothetical protein